MDLHPTGGTFRLTWGFLYDKNRVQARATSTTTININDTDYQAADVAPITGSVSLERKIAPYLGLGFGNAVGKGKHLTFVFDLGATVVALGNPPLCSYKPGDVGRQEGPLAFSVNSDGTFRVPDPTGGCVPPGTIDAAGTVSFVSAGDTCLPGYGVGLACPAGQGTGRCSGTNRCSGTLSQGGVQYTWVMTRVSN